MFTTRNEIIVSFLNIIRTSRVKQVHLILLISLFFSSSGLTGSCAVVFNADMAHERPNLQGGE